jgi:NADP-dependent 3-hydroxy acid dehydrogenase YdfG
MDPADWDTDVFDQHIRVNLTGMSNAIAAVLPGMLQRHHGVIAGTRAPRSPWSSMAMEGSATERS